MQLMYKYALAFLLGAVLAICVISFLSTFTRPQLLGLEAGNLSISVVRLNGESFIAVTGPEPNPLGAHQYVAYNVGDDTIQLGFFVTRVVLPLEGGFQNEWPLLLPESKFRSQSVRLTCKGRNGEELVAIIVKTGDTFEVQRINP